MANKTITSSGTTWTGTAKADKVYIDADYVKVNTGKGNDSIKNSYNYAWYSTLNTGDGNDTITFESARESSINAGAGNDRISLSGGYDLTIRGGKGDDTVYAAANYNLYQYASGDGNDVIYNWGAGDTISITGGTYTKKTSGNNVILTVGTGKITLIGAKDKAFTIKGTLAAGGKTINNSKNKKKLTGTKYADTITNRGSNVTISGGKGADTIINTRSGDARTLAGANSNIDGGNGNDYIYNDSYCDLVTINGGNGNDSIENYSAESTIIGGEGNDSIVYFNNWSNSISGGAGNDIIISTGPDDYADRSRPHTLTGGTGNDTVSLNSGKNYAIINYKAGDGNDLIYGIGSTDTISITGAKYSSVTSGSDIVLTVGSGKITLNGASGKTINIDGTLEGVSSTVPPDTVPSGDVLKGTNGHDNLSNGTGWNLSTGAGKVIYAYGGNDTITNYANNVYISGGNGNDYITSNYGSNSTVHGDAGADNITVQSNNALVYGDDGNDKIITYNEGNFIYGGKGNDNIETRYNNNGYVDGGAGDDTITAYKGTHLTLSGGAGNDYLWGGANSDTLIGGSGDDIFVYKPGEGTDHITDFSGGDMLKILTRYGGEGGTYTSATFSGGNLTLAISGGGTVILDNVKAGQSININGTTKTISGNTLK